MRTQDIRLVASRATHEARAAERLARALHGIGASRSAPGSPLPSSNPPHVVFVDSAPQVRRFDPVRHFGTPAQLLERHYNRPRLLPAPGSGAAAAAPRQTPLVAFPRGARPDRAAMKADKQRLASYAELARRRRRAAKLAGLEGALRKTQALSGNGRVRRLSAPESLRATGGANDGRGEKGKAYKWAKVRKR
jgi:U3 small nucleolar RNA-associated protein 11